MDERYTDGVWYDVQYDSFVTFERDEEAEEAILCDTDGDELDRIAFVDFDEGDYYRIPEDVVEDPTGFLEGRLDRLASGYFAEGRSNYTTYREERSVRYAMNHTDLIEEGTDDE